MKELKGKHKDKYYISLVKNGLWINPHWEEFLKIFESFQTKKNLKNQTKTTKTHKTQGNFMTLEFLSEVSVKHRALSHHMNH